MSIESRMAMFAFSLGQEVRIRALGLSGTVMARMDRAGDIFEFRVIWWSDGKRNDEWLYENELEAA